MYPKSRRMISTSTAMIKAPIADLPSWNAPLHLNRRLFLRRIAKSPLMRPFALSVNTLFNIW
jgi:hypothetical protein